MLIVTLNEAVLLAVTILLLSEYQYTSANNGAYGQINVCFYIQVKNMKYCKTLENFTRINEFMSTSHTKLEIHDQVLTKIYKYSFSQIRHVKELTICNCGVTDIESGAFLGSLSILKLDMQRNKLEHVKTGVFSNLLITHLNLSLNKIATIEPAALSYMQNIEEVYLTNNLITTYDGNWFYKTPLLKSLYFQNNTINSIPERAFRNLIDRPFDLNLFFSFNEIRYIHPLAFSAMESTKVGKLYLDHNLLEIWNETLSKNIKELKISFNNIKCINGDLHETIKNNCLENFKHNPYDCQCLKEIKMVGDKRGERSTWFTNKYLQCRDEAKPRHIINRNRGYNMQIFSLA